ncbi:MAG TPA: hypothetical protein VKK79_05900 [Candidatus Lokiarchaeia archaeon]|nr:hypothetical protein [Candidatus Lokiarchaeia archaeon]
MDSESEEIFLTLLAIADIALDILCAADGALAPELHVGSHVAIADPHRLADRLTKILIPHQSSSFPPARFTGRVKLSMIA